jgi:hypothetical protein
LDLEADYDIHIKDFTTFSQNLFRPEDNIFENRKALMVAQKMERVKTQAFRPLKGSAALNPLQLIELEKKQPPMDSKYFIPSEEIETFQSFGPIAWKFFTDKLLLCGNSKDTDDDEEEKPEVPINPKETDLERELRENEGLQCIINPPNILWQHLQKLYRLKEIYQTIWS